MRWEKAESALNWEARTVKYLEFKSSVSAAGQQRTKDAACRTSQNKLNFFQTTGDQTSVKPPLMERIHHLLSAEVSIKVSPLSVCIRGVRAWFSHHNPSGCVFLVVPAVWLSDRTESGAHSLTKITPHPSDTPTAPPPTSLPWPSLLSHSGIKTTFCLSTKGVKHFLVSHEQSPEPTKFWLDFKKHNNQYSAMTISFRTRWWPNTRSCDVTQSWHYGCTFN